MTQQEVAAELGVAVHTVDSWERKNKIPRGDTLVAMARLYGRRADEFFAEAHSATPGVVFSASEDLPPELRKEAVVAARNINRKYRKLSEGGHRPTVSLVSSR